MKQSQKQLVDEMRAAGKSYTVIAAELEMSINTVKSYCRRKRLNDALLADLCGECDKPVKQTPGARKKKYCNDKCRMAWWAKNPERMNRKTFYQFTCLNCEQAFEAYGNATRKYCSRSCFAEARTLS